MIYTDEEILRRLGLGEDSGWAFKQLAFRGDRLTSQRRDDWANEIAAFANATGGALLCGVSDDGDVQGMSRRQIANLDALLVEVVYTRSSRRYASAPIIASSPAANRCLWSKSPRATQCTRHRAAPISALARRSAS